MKKKTITKTLGHNKFDNTNCTNRCVIVLRTCNVKHT